MCRHRGLLEIDLRAKESLYVAVDSTGLKVYGEGEWKVRQHGVDKRRTWRKLNIGVDTVSDQIVTAVVTINDFKDSEVMDDLLEQMPDNVLRYLLMVLMTHMIFMKQSQIKGQLL